MPLRRESRERTSTAALRNAAWSVTYIASLSYIALVATTFVVPSCRSLSSSLSAFEMFPTRSPMFVPTPKITRCVPSVATVLIPAARSFPDGRKKSLLSLVTCTAGNCANMSACDLAIRTVVVGTSQPGVEGVRMIWARAVAGASMVRGAEVERYCGRG